MATDAEVKEVSNNEILNALNDLNANTVATNNSIKELQEYFIIKDKKELQEKETLKKQEEENAKVEAELKDQEAKEEESAKAEQSAKADQETETYTELLTDINEGIQLNNQLMVVQSIYIGIVVGLLFIKIFVDRLTKK